jgi:hypothetical protein
LEGERRLISAITAAPWLSAIFDKASLKPRGDGHLCAADSRRPGSRVSLEAIAL